MLWPHAAQVAQPRPRQWERFGGRAMADDVISWDSQCRARPGALRASALRFGGGAAAPWPRLRAFARARPARARRAAPPAAAMAAPAPAASGGGPLKWLSLQGALAQCNPGPKPLPRMEIDLSHPLLPPGMFYSSRRSARARPCGAACRGPGGLEPTGTRSAVCSAHAARLARARGAGRALGTRELRGAALRSRLRLAPAR